MSRSTDAVLDDLIGLLPSGWAWNRLRSGILARLLAVVAAAIARVEALVDDLRNEIVPVSAVRLLADFERVLGPSPCGAGGDESGSIGLRQADVARRWTFAGGASRAWFVALAASFGVAITIAEFRPAVCGEALAAQPLITTPEQFVWVVRLAPLWERPAICGDQACGDLLGEVGTSPIECVIRRFAPAHTVVVFDYSGD